jgi:PadR family transcriptional regulator AphA
MNTLSYGLLSLLAFTDMSGYDLMLHIQPFWPAKHSQIYPQLAQLEKEGFVRFEEICQTDKPDKKVYSLTDKGNEVLLEWVSESADAPIVKDEFLLKTYCMPKGDPNTAKRLFEERADFYRGRLKLYDEKWAKVRERYHLAEDEVPGFASPAFGSYLLLTKAIASSKNDLAWCEWVLGLLKEELAKASDRQM